MRERAEFVLRVAPHSITSDSRIAKSMLLGQFSRAEKDEGSARAHFNRALRYVTDELGRQSITAEEKTALSDLAGMLRLAVGGHPLEFVVRGPEA